MIHCACMHHGCRVYRIMDRKLHGRGTRNEASTPHFVLQGAGVG